ncbi:MAG: DHHW family protein [Defluviitaleaceae bacterium]|nr:DHHW family protein [Defluviitaleaceae bacterium]
MKDKINVIVFLSALLLMAVFVYILPTDYKSVEFENRNMESFPVLSVRNYFNGDFSRRFESYLLDNTALRTSWLTFAQIAEYSYGINRQGGAMVVVFDAADLGEGLIPAQLPQELELPPAMPYGGSDSEPADNPVRIFTGGNVNPREPFGLDIHYHPDAVFYLRYVENQMTAARYAEVLNTYAQYLRNSNNIRIFSMIAPVKVEFMGPRYAAVNSSQRGTIDFINGLLDASITTVDAHGMMQAHSDEYLFFRTDHHWTMLGAYYAYLAFTKAADFEPVTIEHYIENTISGFIGSMAVGTRNRTVLANPDTVHFYTLNDGTAFSIDMFVIPPDLSALCYRVFLGGDRDIYKFTTSNKNGKTLVVVKDSFANAIIPWMAPHYETIVVIDPRQFDGSVSDIMLQYEKIDLIFINYIPATTMPELIEQIYSAR